MRAVCVRSKCARACISFGTVALMLFALAEPTD
eukprot:CAMPEP_0115175336 /NCGR_PEP_ID=MMETSP0270-20121206/4306_1 /TAXON_ID=71861 /ORGANISM="Scrippsiella trochoidea, Strain CCMP3099" /LENGTH=32 /DNA_ID= /DNA_START= /DNA_END= /DNA_ORIENTATION=